ncbi:MAG TPA: hypothetical protein VGG25_05485 [Streptosporangiaceae bacterium]|jgi:hypothetical protein
MHKSLTKVLLSGAVAAAAVLTFSVTPAFAATTFTVSPGGAYTGTAGTTTFTDTNTGSALTCKSATAKGTLKSGSGLSGTGIGTITGTTFTTCTGPLGISFTVKQVGTWSLNLTSYTSPTSTGYVSGIDATLSGSLCSATVTGSADATYSNSTGVLTLKPVSGSGHTLTISGVNGCLGLLNNGNTSTFNGAYTISPKQTIT